MAYNGPMLKKWILLLIAIAVLVILYFHYQDKLQP